MKVEEKNNDKVLSINFFSEKTKFEKLEDKFKETIFGVLNILLKFGGDNFVLEMILLCNELFQFLFYPFFPELGYIWKQPALFGFISNFFSYFQTVVFFNDLQLYTVVFYLLMIGVILVILDIVYVSYSLSNKNKMGAVWPMRVLRSIVSFIVTVLFMPIVEFFIAILECSNTDEEGNPMGHYENRNVEGLQCWEDVSYYIMVFLSLMLVFLFVIICTIVQLIYYEIKTSEDVEGAKTNSKADIVSLYIKILLIFFYSFLVYDQSLHWIVVPGTFLSAGLQFYVYWIERPFYEEEMNTAFFLYSGIIFWSTCCLFIGKIFETADFDGCVYLFVIGIPLIVVIILTQDDQRFSLLMMNMNKFQKGESVISQARYFLELVDNKTKDRKSTILLYGYIQVHEEDCPFIDCPLKKFMMEMDKADKEEITTSSIGPTQNILSQALLQTSIAPNNIGETHAPPIKSSLISSEEDSEKFEADIFLYKHAMEMYQKGLRRFPSCTPLRMAYAFFLMERLKDNRKSMMELKTCERYEPSFEEQFIIYRFDQKGVEDNNNANNDEDEMDIVSNIAYGNHYAVFKQGIIMVTTIYSDFWALLLNKESGLEDSLVKMNEYGEHINRFLEQITVNFQEMEKLKYNDQEALTIYSKFLSQIMNKSDQAEVYQKRLMEVMANGNGDNDDNNHHDIPIVDEFDYVYVSADNDQFGTILKASLGVCYLFNYTIEDIIGKSIDLLMPEIFHEAHNDLLHKRLQKGRNAITRGKVLNKIPYKEVFTFGKNKLKQLIPLNMKVNLLQSQEMSELAFVAKINNDEIYNLFASTNPSEGIPPVINYQMKVCWVLTGNDFIIQSYTPNAIKFLSLKAHDNSYVDVTKNINDINLKEDQMFHHYKISKKEMIKQRYTQPKVILWKTPRDNFNNADDEDNCQKFASNVIQHPNAKKSLQRIKRETFKEEYFLLNVIEMKIDDQELGFAFKFEKYNMIEDIEEDNENDIFLKQSGVYSHLSNNNKSHRSSNNDLLTNTHRNKNLNLQSSFVPFNYTRFSIDTTTYGFMENNGKNESCKYINQTAWKDNLKNVAISKLENCFMKLKTISSSSESSSYSDSSVGTSQQNEDEDNDESNIDNISTPNPQEEANDTAKINNNKDDEDEEYNYYHVKMTHIKFSIYDPCKEKFLQMPMVKRESQVEYRKKDNVLNFDTIPGIKKRNTKSKFRNPMGMDSSEKEDKEELDDMTSEVILQKQIDYALYSEDLQPEIVHMQWMSAITFLLIQGIIGIFFYLTLHAFNIAHINLEMLVNSKQLLNATTTGIYLIRELTLLNNKKYTNNMYPPQEYFKNITDELLIIFNISTLLQGKMLATKQTFTNDRYNILTNSTINVKLLAPDPKNKGYSFHQFDLTLNTALTQALTSLYQISCSKLEEMIPAHNHIYFYITNMIAIIGEKLWACGTTFMMEVYESAETSHIFQIVVMSLFVVYSIISVLLIKHFYYQVFKCKSSYLEVFFEIGEPVCKTSQVKCETFLKEINLKEEQELSIESDADINQESPGKSNHDHNNKDNNDNDEYDGLNNEKKRGRMKNIQHQPTKKKKTVQASEDIHVTVYLSLIFLFILGFFVMINIILKFTLIDYQSSCAIYDILTSEMTLILFSYDALREYFLDNKISFINNTLISYPDELLFDRIYLLKKQMTMQLSNQTMPQNFKKLYLELYNGDICSQFISVLFTDSNSLLSKDEINCTTFFNNATSNGIGVSSTEFIEQMRALSSVYAALVKAGVANNYAYNNSLYGTPFEPMPPNPDDKGLYEALDPFQILNTKYIRDLNVMRIYFHLRSQTKLTNSLAELIFGKLNQVEQGFMIGFILLFVVMTAGFLFVWKPFEIKLSKDVSD